MVRQERNFEDFDAMSQSELIEAIYQLDQLRAYADYRLRSLQCGESRTRTGLAAFREPVECRTVAGILHTESHTVKKRLDRNECHVERIGRILYCEKADARRLWPKLRDKLK